MKLFHNFLIATFKGYKSFVSPYMPGECRFTPTCSEYMFESIQVRGLWYGLLLGIYRLLRCNPFSKGGYDPPLKVNKFE